MEALLRSIRGKQIGALRRLVTSTMKQLRDRVAATDERAERYDAGHMRENAGPFAREILDIEVLSTFAGKSAARGLDPTRRARVVSLIHDLEACDEALFKLEAYGMLQTSTDQAGLAAEIRDQVETLLVILSALKSANRELHPERFKLEETGLVRVTWAGLTDRQRVGLPVPLVEMDSERQSLVSVLEDLLTTGLPFRLIFKRRRLVHGPGAAFPELLPLVFPEVSLLQMPPVLNAFPDALEEMLQQPGPVILSVPERLDDESADSFKERQRRLLEAGAFPVVQFKPYGSGALSGGFHCPEGLTLSESALRVAVAAGDLGLVCPETAGGGDWFKAHLILCNRLRQLSGLDNPEMTAALAKVRETLSKAHAEEMEALRRSLGEQAQLQKEQAIKEALGSIASRLVG